MNKNETSFFKENELSNHENQNKEFKLQKSKICLKLMLLILGILIIVLNEYLNNQFLMSPNNKINMLKKFIKVNEHIRPNKNDYCDNIDPIKLFSVRLKKDPITLCQNGISKHFCYQNNYYDDIFFYKDGAICKMENVVLDPSKSKHTDIIYKGPVDKIFRGCPILSQGFFNMKCNNKKDILHNFIYNSYFDSWNYTYDSNEKLDELAPGKIIFFISRNQDSPNIFHGGSELVNAISIMDLFNLNPENIQIIFLESMTFNNDPFYDLYKNIVSRGGEPIFIRNLKKKYHISSAIHVPVNWDSGAFIYNKFRNCKHSTKTYELLNDLVNKYMKIQDFKDKFISDNEIYYYPQSIIDNYKSNIVFDKTVTIEWRKVWPKGRKGQKRILANGPELADKLASILPKNVLIRLVDTASLSIVEQISIMKKTDYLVGIHGAGLCLSVFMPQKSILHEVLPRKDMTVLTLMSALSGHVTYSDIIRYKMNKDDGNENIFFKPEMFAHRVLNHMLENGLL